jgi:enoyl-CoA hydratase/carnithine racemase
METSPPEGSLNVRAEGPVLFAEIATPPMNLLGPELVRDLVSLLQRAEADDAVAVLVFSDEARLLDAGRGNDLAKDDLDGDP